MDKKDLMPRWIFFWSVGTAVLTWGLIMVGGVVHGTGSSLACPDWPTCHGSFFPKMEGAIFYEHGHRALASLVGLFTVLLWVFSLWRGSRKVRNLSFLAVLLVVFQGVLGGLTVLYRLPPAVSIGHLATSLAFLALLVWIAALSWKGGKPSQSSSYPAESRTSLKKWILLALSLVYVQLVLGGMVRHLGAGLACVDLPFCQGSIWPGDAPFILKIHMLHRIFAVAVALEIFLMAGRVWSGTSPKSPLRFLANFAIGLVILQILLGLLSISTALELIPVTAHLGVGAFLWVDLVLLYFLFIRSQGEVTQPI